MPYIAKMSGDDWKNQVNDVEQERELWIWNDEHLYKMAKRAGVSDED